MTSAPKVAHSADDAESALRTLPFEVAHALARLAWHEGWRASLSRASKIDRGDKAPILEELPKAFEHHKKKAKESREAWSLLQAKWADEPRGQKAGTEATSALQQLAKAAAEHAASMRVYSVAGVKKQKGFEKFMEKQKKEQDEHWQTFETVSGRLKDLEGVLTAHLRECACCLIWRACWHSAVTVGERIDDVEMEDDSEEDEEDFEDEEEDADEQEEDEEDEDEEKRFGEEYLGSYDDDIEALSHMLDSLRDCFWKGTPSFGVRLDVSSISASEAEAELASIASVPGAFDKKALNAVRLVVPDRAGEKDPLGEVLRASLAKVKALELQVHLELVAEPGSQQEAWLRSLAAAISSCTDCVQAVSLPGATDLDLVTSSVAALRKGGLTPERCRIYCPVPGGVSVDDEDEWTPEFSTAMRVDPAATGLPIPFQDGNLLFEGPVPLQADEPFPDLQSVLDAASHLGDDIDPAFSLVSSLSLRVPDIEKPKRKKDSATPEEPPSAFYAEFFQRLIGSGMQADAGFFFETWLPVEGDSAGLTSLKACLERGVVDLSAETQVIQPTGAHKASLVYLHGFQCDGYGYLVEPEDFYRPKAKKKSKDKKKTSSTKKSGKSEEEGDEEEQEYEPWPGLKVICPSAPTRSITAHDGEESPAWYDYLTDLDGEAEDDQPDDHLEEQARRIHAILDAEVAKVGARNVFLGGASQGCCMAMHAALTYERELGGVVGTMGHPLSRSPVTAEWVARKIPVYCYIGLADTTMPWDKWVGATWQRIEDAGVQLHVRKDEGIDHGEGEGEWLRHFLAEVLKPASVKTASAAAKKKGKK